VHQVNAIDRANLNEQLHVNVIGDRAIYRLHVSFWKTDVEVTSYKNQSKKLHKSLFS
jgi:hypothetical protein